MIKSRNSTLDSIRAIAVLLIVTIHAQFPGFVGSFLLVFARCAVPFFLILSGYFSNFYTDYSAKTKKQVKRFVKAFLLSSLVYLIINLLIHVFNCSMTVYLNSIENPRVWINLLVFNYANPILGVSHLWYLLCIIYVLVFTMLVEKKKAWNNLLCVSVGLTVILYVMELLQRFDVVFIPTMFYRNFLFEGIPLFVFGRYTKKTVKKITDRHLILLMIACVLAFVLEVVFLGTEIELYICSIITAWTVLLFGIKHPERIIFLSKIGCNLSFNIYLFHYVFIIVFNKTISNQSLAMLWIRPVLVIILSIVMSQLLYFVKTTVKSKHS